ncbi:tyrosyl-DNA phosphodiesterase domain-containing protein [Nannizzia gypsea CBS 118893]|uniref:Tyrosyl-DNA phosphodiesterase domain-containing protein n=1 Tax=Arthroderma gypseum (strain ATCC MYA-4604 / CBS 118893) TaxID=535722 RepID=E4UZE5_ARTGP|nr:tyrosyl-DNA phosphodiesterase domain-containing protein [Nannizzia gypsea CBS 118893]EFR03475.1 tyrosyl-DNA phosphodiesterase domain-containing protein [Nannizzia gypsea CBS 118893]
MMDDDLQAAIDASLRDAARSQLNLQRRKSSVVDLTCDSDGDASAPQLEGEGEEVENDDYDADLKRAIQLSLQSGQERETIDVDALEVGEAASATPEPKKEASASVSGFGIAGFDRKKMEEERLARLAKKRKAGEDGSALALPTARPLKASRSEQPSGASSSAKIPIPPATAATKPAFRASGVPSTEPTIQFPDGAVKKTWAFGHERRGDIKLEEVLQQADLELAVLSSFLWDMDWLLAKFTNPKTRFLFIMGAKGEERQAQLMRETASMPWIRLCFPPMDGEVHCMHSKLMLLFHPNHMRIVIPSANLDPYDWGEKGGVMENMLFLIDLPRKAREADEDKTPFRDELVYFLRASKLNEKIIDKMLQFDFSNTTKYAFVHSIGGSHIGSGSYERTGHCGLGTAVKSLGLETSRPLTLDYITSSVGSLTATFLQNLYLSAQGDNGSRQLSARAAGKQGSTNKKKKTRSNDDDYDDGNGNDNDADWTGRVKVYFPSRETVRSSRGGVSAAGTLCLMSRWYNSPTFPRDVMRDNRSVREGLLMHSKVLYVRPEGVARTDIKTKGKSKESESDRCRYAGWAYVGSANLSESAWGRLVIDRKTKQAKLNCRNWECGVVVPVGSVGYDDGTKKDEQDQKEDEKVKGKGEGELSRVFGEAVPVPMREPDRKYAGGEQPWFYLEHGR